MFRKYRYAQKIYVTFSENIFFFFQFNRLKWKHYFIEREKQTNKQKGEEANVTEQVSINIFIRKLKRKKSKYLLCYAVFSSFCCKVWVTVIADSSYFLIIYTAIYLHKNTFYRDYVARPGYEVQ